MRHNRLPYWGIFSLALGGCAATFEPRLRAIDLDRKGLPSATYVHAGLEVSVEEFASSHKSRRAFDADLSAHSVLPLLIRIENNGSATYIVQSKNIQALANDEPLALLHGLDAADLGGRRNPLWPALVNTAAIGPLAIYFWPLTMAGSASHTQRINQQVAQHFESLELADAVVKPGEKVAGFVFFQLPSRANGSRSTSLEITLPQEVAGEMAPSPIRFKLDLPAPEIPGSRELASGGR